MLRNLFLLIAAFLLLLSGLARTASAEITPPVVYTGVWQVQPNGDVKITCTFKLTLQGYVYCKEHNVAMLVARNFASGRASAEFSDVKADWDDMKHVLVLSMTGLGFAHNAGSHWEVRIQPDIQFSNINAGNSTAYFSSEKDGPMGHIVGHDEIVLPAGCSKLTWNASGNLINYVLPTAYPRSYQFLLVLSAAAALLGLAALALSFLLKAAPARALPQPIASSPAPTTPSAPAQATTPVQVPLGAYKDKSEKVPASSDPREPPSSYDGSI